jgi:DNA integrity scanning protein DisA with diadenylate cyclase activity
MPLNQSLRSDYYFGGEDGRTRQFGRVQAGELLGNIDSMEDELRRYYNNADENNQIIEGVISDAPITKRDKSMDSLSVRLGNRPATLFSYRVAANGYIFDEHSWNVSADLFFAWVYRLYEAGVQTFFTWNYVGTAKFISAVYRNCQKPVESHNTLNRYYIPRIALGAHDEGGKRIQIRDQNPFVKALMALSQIYHLDIGEKKATALATKYKTLLDIVYATPQELMTVEGIGKKTAMGLLTAVGMENDG